MGLPGRVALKPAQLALRAVAGVVFAGEGGVAFVFAFAAGAVTAGDEGERADAEREEASQLGRHREHRGRTYVKWIHSIAPTVRPEGPAGQGFRCARERPQSQSRSRAVAGAVDAAAEAAAAAG